MKFAATLVGLALCASPALAQQPEPEDDDDAEGGAAPQPPPVPPTPKPDWGTSQELDTVSPWSGSEQERWGESRETVSPWSGPPPAPHDVDARFDVPLGDRKGRRATAPAMVRGGIYDRPYLARVGSDTSAVAIGGYADIVGSYEVEQGISEGVEFEMRRFNIFITSLIADRVRLTSELEFEHGTEEIALETALVDVMFHHAINLRGGVILVPIGKFNLAHDAPLYDVIDRPLVSTQIIPATLSEVGFGLFGVFYPQGGHQITYEAYAVSGLGDGVIAAEGTRLSQGKPETFDGDNNGLPGVVARVAYVSPASRVVQGEIGASTYHAIYNTFEIEEEKVDDARWLRINALDAAFSAGPFALRGEIAHAHIDVAPTLGDNHAHGQVGFYGETTVTPYEGELGPFERASFVAVARGDYVDLNLDNRGTTGEAMGDEHVRLSVGVSWRPAPGTSLRVVYHHDWLNDDLGNPSRAGGVQFGIATYF